LIFASARSGGTKPVSYYRLVGCLTAGSAVIGTVVPAIAGPDRVECPDGHPFAAAVVAVGGDVGATRAQGGMLPLAVGTQLCPGDGISTGADGRVEVQFTQLDTTVGLSRNSSLKLPETDDTAANVDMQSGVMRFLSSVRRFFVVRTRLANAGIDGTEAVIAVDGPQDDSLFVVQEGDVTLTTRKGGQASLSLDAGQAGYVSRSAGLEVATTANVPPKFRDMVADPTGASDWAIYFPPVLGPDAPAVAREAAARLRAGDPNGAEALLAGRDDAASLSLAALIAVLRNRTDEGAALAARAVAADPGLPAAHVAQSHALQAQGQVTAARKAAERAVAAGPADVDARARLAELLLTEGDRAAALGALGPIPEDRYTANGRAVEGLALLAVNRRKSAVAAFEKGIALDSEAPLPRLGLGLAKIRAGDLADGRRDLELAAALDPRRANLRSWLGRAYYAEGLTHKARSQFEMAEERDPDDPTPWLLSAIERFAANSPVEALNDIEAARGRGENRAVLRGAAGLGEDRAVNAAALGRVYEALGFSDRAIAEGAHAAEQDPTNPEAHRLLADVLRDRPSLGSARSSAVLQAQVYGPPSTAPIQPELSESDLALLKTTGAARASFAEFSPFFDSDGVRVVVSGTGGTQDTLSDDASFTAKQGAIAVGVGQFHFQSSGYANNNDVRHDVVSLQAKAQIAPMFEVFGEYRYRDTESGDRMLEFDLSNAIAGLTEKDQRNLVRLGIHGDLGASHDVAAVFTYVDRDTYTFVPDDDIGFSYTELFGGEKAHQGQLQHVGRFGNLTTVSGFGYGEGDGNIKLDSVSNFDVFCDLSPDFCGRVDHYPLLLDRASRHFTAYHYSTLRLDHPGPIAGAELTAGVSIDDFHDSFPGGRDTTQVNPKLGARIEITDGLILRGAYTQALKGDLLLDQQLEPVTVAGFTQVPDQVPGATIRQAAVGVDVKLQPWLWVGGTGAWRWIEAPRFDATDKTVNTDERELHGYVNATFGDRVAATLDVSHEHSTSGAKLTDLEMFEVTELHGGASYFHPSGFFASAGLGYVWHKFDGFGRSGSDDFPIADATLGFRLPNERGVISLQVQNALDKSFGFEDRPLLSLGSTTATPRFAREFTALARVTLNF